MYVNYGQGQQNVEFWGLSPYDDNVQINNYKAQNGITYPCAGYQGGAAAAINIVISGQPFFRVSYMGSNLSGSFFYIRCLFPPSITCLIHILLLVVRLWLLILLLIKLRYVKPILFSLPINQ